ncbi:hypothetical protein OF83DRAFT_1085873 [Amylostereum chailletii]|nr:hypothetical protein OF83DRAFT_1085873 [Amylostereum chailletii]
MYLPAKRTTPRPSRSHSARAVPVTPLRRCFDSSLDDSPRRRCSRIAARSKVYDSDITLRRTFQTFTAVTPVGRLPVELLREIFFYLSQESCEQQDTGHFSWTVVTHVCTHWRRVAHGYKQLWSSLPAHGCKWTELSLELSQPLPVSIHHVAGLGQSEGLLAALEGISRARRISVGDTYEASPDGTIAPVMSIVLQSLTRFPAPLLELLDLFDAGGDASVELPDDIFTGQIPAQLTTLILDSVGFTPFQPLFLAPLTTLNLRSCKTGMTIQSMLKILAALPSLEDLSMEDTDFTDQMGDPLEESTCTELACAPHSIHLPRLQRLSLIDSVFMITTIMLYFSLPIDVVLEFDCDCQSTTAPAAISAASVMLEDHFGSIVATGLCFRELVVAQACVSANHCVLEMSDPVLKSSSTNPAPALPSTIRMGWSFCTGDEVGIIPQLVAIMPAFRDVSRLQLSHPDLQNGAELEELGRWMDFSRVEVEVVRCN